ncbi:PREDICTED: two-component response regulator ORR9-like [Nelumbo nucifera]|uniref:Response regulatory domain-containing protein n=2 Tax=Nelumbo nucifera TaxID=4432 RepID=A0A822Z8C4_NELNU|nr:PREDICTED: two-component response regulator ORR9-like [Nelumbo nucifera]DAD39725.1 TPA_asm: hypothetical protein HUJ06_014048 [Nelumbo nucifera]
MDLQAKLEETQPDQHFHVLAVDDSLIDRKLLEKLLTVSSYQVTCVESGDKALEYLGLLDNLNNDSTSSSSSSPSSSSQQESQGVKVNLIMTDYCMPGMTGYDLLKRVKKSSWKDVPVVVMSSENVPSRINMCLEGGAEEFLLKPVRLSDVKKLESHLLKSLTFSSDTDRGEDDCNIIINNNNDDDNNNNVINKRKAMSPEPSERRSAKWKSLTVL